MASSTEALVSPHQNAHCRVCQGRDSGEVIEVINPLCDPRGFSLTIFSHGRYLPTEVFWLDLVCYAVDGERTPESMVITYVSDPRVLPLNSRPADYLVKCMRRNEISPSDEIAVADGAALRLVHRSTASFWQCSWPVAHITRKELS